MCDLVDVWDEFPIMRHVGFLVVGSEFALDGKEKDLEIPLLLKPEHETENFTKGSCSQEQPLLFQLYPPV